MTMSARPASSVKQDGDFHAWVWDSLQRNTGTLHLCRNGDFLGHVKYGAEEGSRRAVRSLRRLGEGSPYVRAVDAADGSFRPAVHYAAKNGDIALVRALAEYGKVDLDARVESFDLFGSAVAESAIAFTLRTAPEIGPEHAACVQYLRQHTKLDDFERKKLAEAGKRKVAKASSCGRRRRPRQLPQLPQRPQLLPPPQHHGSSSGSELPPAERRRATAQAKGRSELTSMCGKSKWSRYYANTALAPAHGAREVKRAEFSEQVAARTRDAEEENARRIHKRTLGFIPGAPSSPYKMNAVGMPVEMRSYPFRGSST